MTPLLSLHQHLNSWSCGKTYKLPHTSLHACNNCVAEICTSMCQSSMNQKMYMQCSSIWLTTYQITRCTVLLPYIIRFSRISRVRVSVRLGQGEAWLSIWIEMQMILHMVQLMPLPPAISCFIKIQNGLPLWCRLTQVVLEKRLLNQINQCCSTGSG